MKTFNHLAAILIECECPLTISVPRHHNVSFSALLIWFVRRRTIWGESAGASSAAQQVLGYGGDTSDLFRGAIMASGTFFGFGQMNIYQGQMTYDNITNHTGCADAVDTLQCLKDLPFKTLNDTVFGQNQGQNFGPVIDGDFLRSYSIVAFNNG